MNKEHYARIEPVNKHLKIAKGELPIAETDEALLLSEVNHGEKYPDVYYVPKTAVQAQEINPSGKKTSCPIKGEATYWNMKLGDKLYEDVAWSYEDPKEDAKEIEGKVAFDLEKIGAKLH